MPPRMATREGVSALYQPVWTYLMHHPPHDHSPTDAPKGPEYQPLVEMGQLWSKAYRTLAAYVNGAVADFHDAEDIIQQTAVVAAQKFHEYDRSRPFAGWVIGIARHKILNHYQKHGRDRHTFAGETLDKLAATYEELSHEDEPIRIALRHCMEKLSARARKLLELRYTRELQPARIAEKMAISPNAVSAALSRVRRSLEECIRRRMKGEVER